MLVLITHTHLKLDPAHSCAAHHGRFLHQVSAASCFVPAHSGRMGEVVWLAASLRASVGSSCICHVLVLRRPRPLGCPSSTPLPCPLLPCSPKFLPDVPTQQGTQQDLCGRVVSYYRKVRWGQVGWVWHVLSANLQVSRKPSQWPEQQAACGQRHSRHGRQLFNSGNLEPCLPNLLFIPPSHQVYTLPPGCNPIP